jgi:hypothetical protein
MAARTIQAGPIHVPHWARWCDILRPGHGVRIQDAVGMMRWRQVDRNDGSIYPYRFIMVLRGSQESLAKIKDRTRQVDVVAAWCVENFPIPHDDWFNGRWVRQGSGFLFRYEDDAFAFKMRWC